MKQIKPLQNAGKNRRVLSDKSIPTCTKAKSYKLFSLTKQKSKKSKSDQRSLAVRTKVSVDDNVNELNIQLNKLIIPDMPENTINHSALTLMDGSQVANKLLGGNVSFRQLGDHSFPLPVRSGDRPLRNRSAFVHFVAYCRDMGRLKDTLCNDASNTRQITMNTAKSQRSISRSSDIAQAWLYMSGREREPFIDRELTDDSRYRHELMVFNGIVDNEPSSKDNYITNDRN